MTITVDPIVEVHLAEGPTIKGDVVGYPIVDFPPGDEASIENNQIEDDPNTDPQLVIKQDVPAEDDDAKDPTAITPDSTQVPSIDPKPSIVQIEHCFRDPFDPNGMGRSQIKIQQ